MSASDGPFIPFYTSDFLAGTSGMTASTKGVYITLISLMYESEAPLNQQWDTLARRCGCTLPAFKKAVATLEDDGKIDTSQGSIWSDKCDKHITLRRERAKSAKAAAKKRWGKSEQKQGDADANALSPQCKPEPEPEIGSSVTREATSDREKVCYAIAKDGSGQLATGKVVGGLGDMQILSKWKSDLGLTIDEIVNVISEIMRQRTGAPPATFAYFNQPMQRYAGGKSAPAMKPQTTNGGPRNGRPNKSDRVSSVIKAATIGTSNDGWGLGDGDT